MDNANGFFCSFIENSLMMTTVTVKIDERTKAGKTFLALLDFFSHEEKGVEITHTPNYETLEAIQDARNGKVISAENVTELFTKLKE